MRALQRTNDEGIRWGGLIAIAALAVGVLGLVLALDDSDERFLDEGDTPGAEAEVPDSTVVEVPESEGASDEVAMSPILGGNSECSSPELGRSDLDVQVLGPGQIQVSWSELTSGAYATLGYQILTELHPSGEVLKQSVLPVTAEEHPTNTVVSNLEPGVQYCISVRGCHVSKDNGGIGCDKPANSSELLEYFADAVVTPP